MQKIHYFLMRKYTKNRIIKNNKETIFRIKKSILIIIKKNHLLVPLFKIKQRNRRMRK